MVDKVHGAAAAGEFLGKQLDFFAVTGIALAGGGSVANKKLVEKIIETISINGQPIMLSGTLLTTADLINGTYVLNFAVEHQGSNVASGLKADRALATGEALVERINAIDGVSGASVALRNDL
jgi:hypothetical protein